MQIGKKNNTQQMVLSSFTKKKKTDNIKIKMTNLMRKKNISYTKLYWKVTKKRKIRQKLFICKKNKFSLYKSAKM